MHFQQAVPSPGCLHQHGSAKDNVTGRELGVEHQNVGEKRGTIWVWSARRTEISNSKGSENNLSMHSYTHQFQCTVYQLENYSLDNPGVKMKITMSVMMTTYFPSLLFWWSPSPLPSLRQLWVWTWPRCWWWRRSSSARWRACPPPPPPLPAGPLCPGGASHCHGVPQAGGAGNRRDQGRTWSRNDESLETFPGQEKRSNKVAYIPRFKVGYMPMLIFIGKLYLSCMVLDAFLPLPAEKKVLPLAVLVAFINSRIFLWIFLLFVICQTNVTQWNIPLKRSLFEAACKVWWLNPPTGRRLSPAAFSFSSFGSRSMLHCSVFNLSWECTQHETVWDLKS